MSAPVPKAAAPKRPGVVPPYSILCFGYHPWSPTWKRNQSLMAALAGRPSIAAIRFVNPEVSLLVGPRRLRAELHTDHRYRWGGVRLQHPRANVVALTPVRWLPFRGRVPALAELDRRLLRNRILGPLQHQRFLLYVNGVREEVLPLVDLARESAAFQVFDWSDDFAEFPRDPAARAHINALTHREIDAADLVLAVNENLAARARARGARVETVINATGLEPLPAGGGPGRAGARALAARLPRPVIGYAGFINEHRVDAELVRALAKRHPNWTILFLGLVQLEFDRHFRDLANVHFHPLVPHSELADYLGLFDVCLIPHLDNAHTAGNNPLKLYDYLTTGKPIVATRISGLEGFEDVVAVARDHERFIHAVEDAVHDPGPPAAVAARLARAAEHSWEARAAQVEAAIARALADRRPEAASGGAGAERR
jgi:glycosyltransferase involved in cell wall biosynthesis